MLGGGVTTADTASGHGQRTRESGHGAGNPPDRAPDGLGSREAVLKAAYIVHLLTR